MSNTPPFSRRLSENQCGMEIMKSDWCKLSGPVEREPMWDGNTRVYDGLRYGLRVEREPMWDGNATELMEKEFEPIRLSENQCGMEMERLKGISCGLPS